MDELGQGTVVAETYEVEKLLGRGGMGAVWAARHLRLPGKRVAIKVLLGAAASDREAYARFRREAEIASSIGHPNIVEVLDFNTLPSGTPYLVLELLEGEDLAARIARGPMALDDALRLARQIGSALAAAHRHEVVHRDLKPGNIYLCPSDDDLGERVKILDFGISKIRGSQTVQTQDSILLGTPQYMSPEQASGKNAELDQRTDVFAMGSILYEMLSGRPAFSGANLVAVVFQVVYETAKPLGDLVPGLPPHVEQAIARAMTKDPAQRYPDVASFITDLTGRPLQTLDRKPVPRPADPAFAATVGTGPGMAAVSPPSTNSRGEIQPIAQPKGGLRTGILVGALAGTAALIAAIVLLGHKPPPITAGASDLAAPPLIARPQPDLAPALVAVSARDLGAPATAIAHPPVTGTHHPPKEETIPPEVQAELASADKALAAGNLTEAVHQARHSLNQRKTSRAFAIITRAYCKGGDLGNANAAFHSVTGGDRAAVKSFCHGAGVDLP